jgi:hypothetical protein
MGRSTAAARVLWAVQPMLQWQRCMLAAAGAAGAAARSQQLAEPAEAQQLLGRS